MCGIAGFVERRPGGRPRDRGADDGHAAPPRARRRRLLPRRPGGAGTSPALDHRRRRRRPADVATRTARSGSRYNGELYNELELRRGARGEGASLPDVVATRRAWSIFMRKRGRISSAGSTACSRWRSGTQPRGRLVLARDRMGQKPLFYGELPGGGLAFGSEPKAVLAHPEVGRALDPASLARYLFYEYVPAPHSIWRSLRKLPRGHVLVVGSGIGRGSRGTGSRRHRSSRPRPTFERDGRAVLERVPRRGGAAPAVGRAAGRLPLGRRRFVERRRRAVRGRAGRGTSGRSRSASRTRASTRAATPGAVARHLGTDHHERTFSVETAYELLPEVAGWLDEPFGDASILPTHLLSRFARERGQGRPGRRRCRRAAGRLSDVRGRAGGRALPAAAAAGAGAGGRGGRPAAGRPRQFQPRLQAQAVPPRRGRAAAAGTSALARLVLRRRDRRLLVDGDPIGVEAEHLRRAADARRRRRPAVPLAGPLPGHVSARGHPDQGRPGQHGLRAGGPGPVPRRRAGRLRPDAARRRSSSAATRPSGCSSGRRPAGCRRRSWTGPRRASASRWRAGSAVRWPR